MTNPLLLIHLRNQYTPSPLCIGDPGVIRLLDEHERLEAEVERLEDVVVRQNLTAATLHDEHLALRAEHARICNEHALLVNESSTQERELHRLESMIRAWHAARGDDESEAAIEMWREAVRLARATT